MRKAFKQRILDMIAKERGEKPKSVGKSDKKSKDKKKSKATKDSKVHEEAEEKPKKDKKDLTRKEKKQRIKDLKKKRHAAKEKLINAGEHNIPTLGDDQNDNKV